VKIIVLLFSLALIYPVFGFSNFSQTVILVFADKLSVSTLLRTLADKNTFFRYDFDRDGYIIQEDVRLVLSHVPIENKVVGHVAQEGVFTSTGGGRLVNPDFSRIIAKFTFLMS
jgi:hypothetical protein